MRALISISFLSILLFACKEKTSYQMQLLIENNTNNKITVELFPKPEYLHNTLYDFSDFGGGYSETIFEVEQNKNKYENIYYSSNIDQEPFELAVKIFDSIHITPFNENKTVMKFSIDTVTGYSENLFDSSSNWKYEIRNYDMPDNFNRNPVESYDYTFVISPDRY